MRSWPETYAKDVLGTILELRGQVITEYELVERRLRADMLFLPDPARRVREDLGIIERMIDLGQGMIELFSATPRAQAGFDCVGKHLSYHGERCNHARHKRKARPPRPHLWMISPGRPRSLIADLPMQPMAGWPPGFWHMAGKIHVHLIVISELPEVPETLLLRLLGKGKRLERARAELKALPPRSRLRCDLEKLMYAWHGPSDTTREKTMLSPESKARYAAWEKKVRSEERKAGLEEGERVGLEKGKRAGRKEGKRAGRKEGKRAGRKEGEQRLLRKQLELRFGELPPDAERRIKRASLAKLELWGERVLTAKSLAAVFAD